MLRVGRTMWEACRESCSTVWRARHILCAQLWLTASIRIAGKMREVAASDFDADPVPRLKVAAGVADVDRDQIRRPWFHWLRPAVPVAIPRAQNSVCEVHRRSARSDVTSLTVKQKQASEKGAIYDESREGESESDRTVSERGTPSAIAKSFGHSRRWVYMFGVN